MILFFYSSPTTTSGFLSIGKTLMTLITGLVCAINLYFVVTTIMALDHLAYYIVTGFVLVGYVAFVCYLV